MAESKETMLREVLRPKKVADLVGQKGAKALIEGWLTTGNVPRTILVTGSFSTGKTTIARLIGRALLCYKPIDAVTPCGKCGSCRAFDEDDHVDFQEMNAADKRGVDDMRQLAGNARIMPMDPHSNRRIVLLDEVHMLTTQAWQSMLKPLEKPPQHLIYIMCTTEGRKVPETIRSRCSELPLQPMTLKNCAKLLRRALHKTPFDDKITDDQLTTIAKTANCAPRSALNCLEQVIALIGGAKAGGQAVDAAVINSFVKQAANVPADATAAAICRFILQGQPGPALRAYADNRSEADYLIKTMSAIMRQAMYLCVNPKLADGYYSDKIDKVPVLLGDKRPLREVHKICQQLLDLRFKAATYLMPVDDAIDVLIVEACLLMAPAARAAADSSK